VQRRTRNARPYVFFSFGCIGAGEERRGRRSLRLFIIKPG